MAAIKSRSAKGVKEKYNRAALLYDVFNYPLEISIFRKWRKEHLGKLKGDILEIGVGTGKNLAHYSPKAKVMGIDISENMLAKAKKKKPSNIRLHVASAEHLPFKGNSFDYVVMSCVLCSVENPIKALQEAKRVVKPQGSVLMLEHVKSKRRGILFLQKLNDPFFRNRVGCNLLRDTEANIRNAGLVLVKNEHHALGDVFRHFVAKKMR